MKQCFLILIGLLLIASVSFAADIEREFEVAKGDRLTVNLKSGGSLEIQGWDKDQASIEVDFVRCDPDDFDFEMFTTSSGLKIISDYNRHVNRSNIDVRIMLPREFNLRVKTSGGSIDINDIEGSIRGSTGGGSLNLQNLDGEIDLSTGGGRITVRDSRLDGEVTTGGGRVLVENVEGDFDARSGGGNVVFKNVTTPDRDYPPGLVHIRNAGGKIDVDDAPNGADVNTGGGDIYIRSAGEFAIASTGGGDITIEEVDGWVKASTGAGDIEVTMVGDPDNGDRDVTLLTGLGDIELVVPKSLSMDIDIELAYTKRSSGRYKIKSDFDINEERTDEWDYDRGTPVKYIYGDATIGDGKNRIKIRTTNGNVTIRQGD